MATESKPTKSRPSNAAFYQHKTAAELAAEQGVGPIDEQFLDEISDFWPDDESTDDFLDWLYKMRREGGDTKTQS